MSECASNLACAPSQLAAESRPHYVDSWPTPIALRRSRAKMGRDIAKRFRHIDARSVSLTLVRVLRRPTGRQLLANRVSRSFYLALPLHRGVFNYYFTSS